MRTGCKLAVLGAAVWLSAVAHAQGPASQSTAQHDTAAVSEASQPVASKKADRAANRALARKIRQALNKTKGLEGADVAVFANARTGDVILGGFIDNQGQEHIATDAASKVPGVKSVSSKILMRPPL